MRAEALSPRDGGDAPAAAPDRSSTIAPERAARRRHALMAAGYAATLVVARLMEADAHRATLFGVAGPRCAFATLFGLPCPGCGLTRGFAATTHGDFALATAAHPAAPALVALTFAAALVHASAASRTRVGRGHEYALRLGRAAFLASLAYAIAARCVGG